MIRPLLALLCLTAPLLAKFPTDFDTPLRRIALGSCNRQDLPQPVWDVIESKEPGLWIWMGDNIYGDTRDMDVLKAKYDKQFNQPEYADFREGTPILGTWDDHDYGENDSGSWYQPKADSRDLALRFMEVPKSDPRWSREGLYGAYDFGPAGKRVRVILIDDRYFASHAREPDSELLGEAQWQWLQATLKSSDAQINLIVSGIQVLPEDHRYEKWANFPVSRERLLTFIRENEIPGVIFASGDRHIHELSLKNDNETAYPLLELTSSGMTHAWGERFPGEKNRYRAGPVHPDKGFGLIDLDWEQRTVTTQIINLQGKPENTLSLPMAMLRDHASP